MPASMSTISRLKRKLTDYRVDADAIVNCPEVRAEYFNLLRQNDEDLLSDQQFCEKVLALVDGLPHLWLKP